MYEIVRYSLKGAPEIRSRHRSCVIAKVVAFYLTITAKDPCVYGVERYNEA